MKQQRGRPQRCRAIGSAPEATQFKPAGVPLSACTIITLTLDEYEALRLADYQGLYHEDAAGHMNVSRATFGRIVTSARRKVAQVLVEGQALEIHGGNVMHTPHRTGPGGFCICPSCETRVPHEAGKPCIKQECPQCGKRMLRENGEHHNQMRRKNKE